MKANRIPGTKSYYVTDDGRIFSTDHGFLVEMTPSLAENGYLRVQIIKEGEERRWFPVHRLVLDSHVGERPTMECNHKNGIKTDNRLENLEWLSAAENKKHAAEVLKRFTGENNGSSKLTEAIVREIKKSELTAKELALKYGVTRECVYHIKNGKTWRHVT